MVINGVEITFEQEQETHHWFAHIRLLTGGVFGKASTLRQYIPIGTWVTVPPRLQPAITWLLTTKCGFTQSLRAEIDGEWHDVLRKTE